MKALYRPQFGRAAILPECSGFYQPADRTAATTDAVILGVADRTGAICDIVAWQPPAAPGHWWVRTGGMPVLGEAEIERAAFLNVPLHLFATPSSWLFNHAPGGLWPAACIIDWSADPRAFLSGVEIVCENPILARRLDRRTREQRLKIGVRHDRRAA